MTRIAIDTVEARELASLMRGAAADYEGLAGQLLSEEDLWSVPPEARVWVQGLSESIAARVRELASELAIEAADLEWRAAVAEEPGSALPEVWLEMDGGAGLVGQSAAPSVPGDASYGISAASGVRAAEYGMVLVGGGSFPAGPEGGEGGTFFVGGTDLFGGVTVIEAPVDPAGAGLLAPPQTMVVGGTDPTWFGSPESSSGTTLISGPPLSSIEMTVDPFADIMELLRNPPRPGVGTEGDLALGIVSHSIIQGYWQSQGRLDTVMSPTYQTYGSGAFPTYGDYLEQFPVDVRY